jgi:hypothetical protein
MDLNAIDRLRKMQPDTSFIFICHTTKEGNFKGVNSHVHEVDVIVQVGKGKATSTGRFNADEAFAIVKAAGSFNCVRVLSVEILLV